MVTLKYLSRTSIYWSYAENGLSSSHSHCFIRMFTSPTYTLQPAGFITAFALPILTAVKLFKYWIQSRINPPTLTFFSLPCLSLSLCSGVSPPTSGTRPWWPCVGGSKAWAPRRYELCPRTSCRCLWPWRTSPWRSRRSQSPSPPPTWKSTRPGWPSSGQCRERGWLDPKGAEPWKEEWQLWKCRKPWRGENSGVWTGQRVRDRDYTGARVHIRRLVPLREKTMKTFSRCTPLRSHIFPSLLPRYNCKRRDVLEMSIIQLLTDLRKTGMNFHYTFNV